MKRFDCGSGIVFVKHDDHGDSEYLSSGVAAIARIQCECSGQALTLQRSTNGSAVDAPGLTHLPRLRGTDADHESLFR